MLKTFNEYKKEKSDLSAYAYIQFVSMNGRDKFLNAFKIGACKRCYLRCKGREREIAHKYISGIEAEGSCGRSSGVWPKISPVVDPTLI